MGGIGVVRTLSSQACDRIFSSSIGGHAVPALGAAPGRASLEPSGIDALSPTRFSTGGGAPAVARWAASRLDEGLDALLGLDAEGLTLLVEVFAEVRAELRLAAAEASQAPDPGGVGGGSRMELIDWRSALDGSILDLIHRGRRAEAKERLLACLSS